MVPAPRVAGCRRDLRPDAPGFRLGAIGWRGQVAAGAEGSARHRQRQLSPRSHARQSGQRREGDRGRAVRSRVQGPQRHRRGSRRDARGDLGLCRRGRRAQERGAVLLRGPRRAAGLAQLPPAGGRGDRAPGRRAGALRRRHHADRGDQARIQCDERRDPRRVPRQPVRGRGAAGAEGPEPDGRAECHAARLCNRARQHGERWPRRQRGLHGEPGARDARARGAHRGRVQARPPGRAPRFEGRADPVGEHLAGRGLLLPAAGAAAEALARAGGARVQGGARGVPGRARLTRSGAARGIPAALSQRPFHGARAAAARSCPRGAGGEAGGDRAGRGQPEHPGQRARRHQLQGGGPLRLPRA